MSAVDVLAALGCNRMETAQVARKAVIPVPAARRALRLAEQAGQVSCELADGRFWRRGAAAPLIWRARVGGGK